VGEPVAVRGEAFGDDPGVRNRRCDVESHHDRPVGSRGSSLDRCRGPVAGPDQHGEHGGDHPAFRLDAASDDDLHLDTLRVPVLQDRRCRGCGCGELHVRLRHHDVRSRCHQPFHRGRHDAAVREPTLRDDPFGDGDEFQHRGEAPADRRHPAARHLVVEPRPHLRIRAQGRSGTTRARAAQPRTSRWLSTPPQSPRSLHEHGRDDGRLRQQPGVERDLACVERPGRAGLHGGAVGRVDVPQRAFDDEAVFGNFQAR
jgi:hypothetical protein